MNALHLLLDDELWTDACKEAALRAVDVDALLADVLSHHFARWMQPDTAIEHRSPGFGLRVALAAWEAVEAAEATAARCADSVELSPDGDHTPAPWTRALAAAIGDDARGRAERLERWQEVFRAGERAAIRGQHGEGIERFREALALAGTARIPMAMTHERLARSELLSGRPAAAREHARRAMILTGQAGLPVAASLARLVALVDTLAGGHPAVQHIVAGLVALDQRDASTAAERLSQGARLAADDGRAGFEMRARGALALIRLSAGAGQAASTEAQRAAELAAGMGHSEVEGLMRVLASAAGFPEGAVLREGPGADGYGEGGDGQGPAAAGASDPLRRAG